MDILTEQGSRRRLVLFIKEPILGTVKTRLAKGMGIVAATNWYRHNCLKVIHKVQDLRWQTIIAITPEIYAKTSSIWPVHIPRIPQGNGDLGERMGRIFKILPPGPVIIIGTDILNITNMSIWRAFRLLDGQSVVFAPSQDGGYSLIGLGQFRRNKANLFHKVRWSSEHTLKDTIKAVGNTNIRFTDTLNDIDTIEDFSEQDISLPIVSA